jgi:hypothetical protein
MAIAGNSRARPLELRLAQAKRQQAQHGLVSSFWAFAAALRWGWWHAKAYLPIVGLLLLALGSVVVLQCHWVYRRITHTPRRHKEVFKNVG